MSSLKNHKLVVNYIPDKGMKASFDAWEFAYFFRILEIRDIFVQGLLHTCPDLGNWVYSDEFLEKFSRFLYKYSSGNISPYMEPMNEKLEQAFSNYLLNNRSH